MEHWKTIKGYEQLYNVSSYGNVESLKRIVPTKGNSTRISHGRLLKTIKKSIGYRQVTLSKLGGQKIYLVHRLVAQAFLPNPNNLPQVNHIDGNKENNNLENLEWCTHKQNAVHARRVLGQHSWHWGKLGKDTPTAKPILQLSLDGSLVKRWDCALDAVREHGFDSGCISRVAKGIRNHHKGFKWAYER